MSHCSKLVCLVVGQFPVVKKIAETQRARRSAEGSNKMGCSSAILCVLRVSAFIFSSKRPTTVCLDSLVDYCYIFTAFSQKSPLFSALRGDFNGQGRTP